MAVCPNIIKEGLESYFASSTLHMSSNKGAWTRLSWKSEVGQNGRFDSSEFNSSLARYFRGNNEPCQCLACA